MVAHGFVLSRQKLAHPLVGAGGEGAGGGEDAGGAPGAGAGAPGRVQAAQLSTGAAACRSMVAATHPRVSTLPTRTYASLSP